MGARGWRSKCLPGHRSTVTPACRLDTKKRREVLVPHGVRVSQRQSVDQAECKYRCTVRRLTPIALAISESFKPLSLSFLARDGLPTVVPGLRPS